jgi:hypothetical protein
MKATLIRLGIRGFNPKLKKDARSESHSRMTITILRPPSETKVTQFLRSANAASFSLRLLKNASVPITRAPARN